MNPIKRSHHQISRQNRSIITLNDDEEEHGDDAHLKMDVDAVAAPVNAGVGSEVLDDTIEVDVDEESNISDGARHSSNGGETASMWARRSKKIAASADAGPPISTVSVEALPSTLVPADDDAFRSPVAKRRSSMFVPQELRCPICLTEKEDPTMLSECHHDFCYACICEWLKMKPECPLCKRVPKFFKHKFSGNTKTPTWDTPGERLSVAEMRSASEMHAILARTSYQADVERHAVKQVIQRIEEELRMIQHMSLRTYTKASSYKALIKETQDDLELYQNLLKMFSNASRRELFAQPAFRRVIYLRNLSPRSIVAPQFGVVFNSEYVRRHEDTVRAQLTPYILREFAAITRRASIDVEPLLRIIFDYLTNRTNRLVAVTSLKNCGICHPHQFLNNLAHFAGTGQSLAVYDQNSEYTPRASRVLPYISGNDDVLVINSAVNNDVQVVGESTVVPSSSSGVGEPSSGSSSTGAATSSAAQPLSFTSASLGSALPISSRLAALFGITERDVAGFGWTNLSRRIEEFFNNHEYTGASSLRSLSHRSEARRVRRLARAAASRNASNSGEGRSRDAARTTARDTAHNSIEDADVVNLDDSDDYDGDGVGASESDGA